MSKSFRDSESLGEKYWKDVVSDLIIFAQKWSKTATAKKFFSRFFLLHLFTPLKRLFAHLSQSPISKLFRFSESLGKTKAKKWSQIWILLLIKGVKLSRKKKKLDFWRILPNTNRIFLVLVLLSASVERCFVSRMRDFLWPTFLRQIFKPEIPRESTFRRSGSSKCGFVDLCKNMIFNKGSLWFTCGS